MSFNFRATFSPATLELCFQSYLHLTLIIKKCESNCSSVTFFAFKWKHKYTYIYRSELLLLPLLPRVMQVCLQTSESLATWRVILTLHPLKVWCCCGLWQLFPCCKKNHANDNFVPKMGNTEMSGESVYLSKPATSLVIDGRPAGSLSHRPLK